MRDKLAERGLAAKPVTSGSKGLHLYADLPKRLPSDESSALAKAVAEELQGEHPKLVTATMTKARAVREGVPGLVAERRLEDHDLAVLAARPRATHGRHATVLGGGRGRR